jgi:hypothetical protein
MGGPNYYGGGGPMDFPPDQRGFFHGGGGRENFMGHGGGGGGGGNFMGHGGDFGQQYGGGFAPEFRGGVNNQAEDFGWNPTAVKDYSAGTAGSGSVLRYRFFSMLGIRDIIWYGSGFSDLYL